MKKVKVYLMMSILAIALCACGEDSKEQHIESDSKNKSEKKQEEVIEKEDEETDESEETETSEEVNEEADQEVVQEEGFECLPEILNASFEDCLMQIDNTIIRQDNAMSLNEVITTLQNSGEEYIFKVDDKEYNPNMLVGPRSGVVVYVYKKGESYFIISANNKSDETVSGNSEGVMVDAIVLGSQECAKNTYYAKGFRRDGEGHTYTSVKELLKDYTDFMSEKSTDVMDIYGEEYQGIEMQVSLRKGDVPIVVTFLFKAEDGACVGAYSIVFNPM
ncbi:MAG: hypothetical protein IKK33_15145 [Lachnospiraceae bacterium]|nr:hypothetical protein [Lachnospiraceae bacterium]